MPDPVSNAEIEDVLTSIRRLVSENRQVASAPESEDEQSEASILDSDEPVTNAPMALVLTPALRVSEDAAAEDEGASVEDRSVEVSTHAVSDFDDDDAEALDLTDHAVEISEIEPVTESDMSESGIGEVDADAEEFLVEETPEDVLSTELDDATDDSAELAWDVEFSNDATVPDEIDDAVDDAASAASENILESVTEVTDDADSGGVDHGNEAKVAEVTLDVSEAPLNPEGNAVEVADSGLEQVEEEAGFVEVDEPQDGVEDEPFDFKKVLEARLVNWRDGDGSEVEADTEEPVDSDYTDDEATTSAWETQLEPSETLDAPGAAEVIEAVAFVQAAEDVADAVDAGLSDALDEPAVIDEEALREMVADIVRQELQGALGERITRNVRKLVRREIHRALAAHELD
ncbi:hypothetical protein [Shimia sp. Alg240-R146]|uniref:hypothetical protein n=1 Tax=Shimia sp. Alg240-R146 TaxID=2993449 RepID=UPI0022E22A41|nr:hypothetical protein [Shimia sp. Alg240-R146]